MRLLCNDNSGLALPERLLLLGYTTGSVFPVSIGREYWPLGMSLFKNSVLVLLADDNRLPSWLPIELFSVTEPRLPSEWYFGRGDQDEDLHAIWGYRRLVEDGEHYNLLLERDPVALGHFYSEIALRGRPGDI